MITQAQRVARAHLLPCGVLFKKWVRQLEHIDGFFCIRVLGIDAYWRNRALREFAGIRHTDIGDWSTAIRNTLVADRPKLEDAISLAIKTQEPTVAIIRFNPLEHGRDIVVFKITMKHLPAITDRGACGLVIFHSQPVSVLSP